MLPQITNILKYFGNNIKPFCLGYCNFTSGNIVHDKSQYYEFSTDFPEKNKVKFFDYFEIVPNFLNAAEEESLLEEIDPHLKRMRYQFDHWDKAIEGFRELERLKWKKTNTEILKKIKNKAFTNSIPMHHVHILDLSPDGHIKPHIDSVRFCGEIISGINLLSDAVMRMKDKHEHYYCDVFLERRSLYVMSGPARFDFTHEILPNSQSLFNGCKIVRERRISIILRSEPDE